jgi:hypothetical protein
MNGLLIRSPFVDWILSGRKVWEIRGSRTTNLGRIALIRSASGTVVGTCELAEAIGPLSVGDIKRNARKLGSTARDIGSRTPYRNTYAWVLKNVKRLRTPVPYRHPPGAVIWVRLPDAVERKINEESARQTSGLRTPMKRGTTRRSNW